MTLNIDHLHVDLDGTGVLRDIGLRVGEGELVCLVGRNGAGKTTTFRSIMGFVRPSRGDIAWKGQSLIGMPTHAIARLGLGYTPEGSDVFGELSVADNIALPTWSRKTESSAGSRTAAAYAVFPVLEKFKLEPNLHHSQNLYFETSLENKQRKPEEINEEWLKQFTLLGDNLGVKVE